MKTTSLLLLMLITTSVLFSQENTKFRNNIGYGYFDSKFEPASKGGQYLYGEFGYNLKKDFWLNLRLLLHLYYSLFGQRSQPSIRRRVLK